MRTSVIVPTYRRPDQLLACLEGLRRQTRPAHQVLAIHRADDAATVAALAGFDASGLALQTVTVSQPGVVAALNRGLDHADGDIVAMTDDDAIPQPDWIARLAAAYADPALGAVGGRDQCFFDGRPADWPRLSAVGYTTWYGQTVGNFQVGIGPPRRVEMLKGVNMSFRRAAIGGLRFDTRLLGRGAQFANEMMFCFALRRAGWAILYDPDILVHHHPGTRHEADQRVGIVFEAQRDMHHNMSLCYLEGTPWHRAWRSILWRLATGSRKSPGLAAALVLSLRGLPGMWTGFAAQIDGHRRAIRTWRATRGDAPWRRATPQPR